MKFLIWRIKISRKSYQNFLREHGEIGSVEEMLLTVSDERNSYFSTVLGIHLYLLFGFYRQQALPINTFSCLHFSVLY